MFYSKVADSAVDTSDDELIRQSCYSDVSDSHLDLVPPVVRSQSVALATGNDEVCKLGKIGRASQVIHLTYVFATLPD